MTHINSEKFRQARAEIYTAEQALQSMKLAKSFNEFERIWKIYLNCIEKCWLKVEGICQPIRNNFEPWQGKFLNLRKKDMLLKYLKNARDADQHTIQEVVEPITELRSIYALHNTHIKSLRIDGGNITEYVGSKPLFTTNTLAGVKLLRIKNRSDWYSPPTQHLGKCLEKNDPISIAQHGLEFYKDFLDQAEKEFGAQF